jgi:acyl-coenzyme A thioesterase PaaI-like protein
MSEEEPPAEIHRPWATDDPERLIGRGHTAGDFLEAYDWKVLAEDDGYLHLEAHAPERVMNPRRQIFGGFTPTYVDLVALFTVRARRQRAARRWDFWLATTNMRLDYFEPIAGPLFRMESRLVKSRGRTHFVETRFLDLQGELLVFALTTMREVPA